MFDIVIVNGSVLDGSDREAERLDVGIRGGKIRMAMTKKWSGR